MPNGTGTQGGQGGNIGGSGGTRTSPDGGYGTSNGSSTGGGGGGGPGGGTRGFGAGQGAAAGANIAGNGGNGGGNGFGGPALPTTASQGGNGSVGSNGLYGASGAGGGGGGGAGGYGAVPSANGTLTVNVTGGAGGGGGNGGVNVGGGDGAIGGFGGGGGGGLSFGGAGLTVGAAATLQGGTGGGGGNGGNGVVPIDSGGSAGGGGAGGDGLVLTGTAATTVTNAGAISGAAGGAGGNGGSRGGAEGSDGSDGAGGDGGNGINAIGTGATTLTNSGTISGGVGGASRFGSAGRNGAGVYGSNLTITNTGTISGGGTGGAQANAITFAGGTNSLTPGSGTLNGNIAVDGPSTTLAIKASGATTLGNVITGTGSLTFGSSAASVITLTGANTYTGTTTVAAGTLVATTANALGAVNGSTQVNSGATLKIEGAGFTLADDLTLSGMGVGNGGALRNRDDTGSTNEILGTITLGAASRINSDTGFLDISASISSFSGTNFNLTVGGAGVTEIQGPIQTGTGTLTKDGTGTAILSGTNTYTGVTTVSNGLLGLLGGSAITDTGSVVINAPGSLQLDSSETVGSIAGSGSITLSNGTLTTGGNNNSTTFSGILRDNGPAVGGLAKIGTGTLTLSGANTYSQGTTISGGTLKLSNTSTTAAVAALGSGGVSIASGATLDVSNAAGAAANFVLGNTISGAGTVVYGGSAGGVTNVTGGNTYTGRTTIAAGTLVAKTASALGASAERTDVNAGATLKIEGSGLTFNENLVLYGTGVGNGGTLRNVGTGDPAGTNNVNNILLGSASRINSDAGILQINGLITGPGLNLTFGGAGITYAFQTIQTGTGALTKDGTGIVALYGSNTYTGTTTVSNGLLDLLNGNAIDNSGAVVIKAPGGLRLFNSETVGSIAGSGGITLSNATLTAGGNNSSTSFSGTIGDFDGTHTGKFEKTGTGTLTLSGANSYSGYTFISAGTLKLSNTSTTSAVASLGSDVIYVFSGAVLEIANADRNEGEFTIANSILEGGSLKFSGPNGAWTVMRGANSYTGGTTITSGIVEIGNDSALGGGRVTMTGGAIRAIDSAKILANAFTLSGTIGVGFATDLTGAIDLAANTILTPSLNAGSTWSGGLSLGSRALTLANTGPNSAGGTWAGATLTISGTISGTGRIVQGSSGNLILTGANTYSGGTTINFGTVTIGNASALGTGTFFFGRSNTSLRSTITTSLANGIGVGANTARIGANGGETLTLTGPVSGTGTFQVDSGTLALSRAVSFTGTAAVLSGATLALTGAGSLALAAGVTMSANSTFDISGVTSQATLKTLVGGGSATSSVLLGGKRLTINAASEGTKVTYDGAPGLASTLVINAASQNFTLGTAAFANWTVGQDTIRVNGNGLNNTITGTSLDDILDGGSGDDTLKGGNGNDTYYVDSTSDQVIESGVGMDTVRSTVSWTLGAGVENLTLEGPSAIDGTGNDLANIIIGNAQSNTIEGGGRNDTLSGGSGADIFVYHAGFAKDTVTDFAAGGGATRDVLRFDQSLFASYDSVLNATTDSAAGAVITFDASNTITLTGVARGDLIAANFAFV